MEYRGLTTAPTNSAWKRTHQDKIKIPIFKLSGGSVSAIRDTVILKTAMKQFLGIKCEHVLIYFPQESQKVSEKENSLFPPMASLLSRKIALQKEVSITVSSAGKKASAENLTEDAMNGTGQILK